ncbi:unnamed protein product, partial [Brassica rapa subsp. narinosa]
LLLLQKPLLQLLLFLSLLPRRRSLPLTTLLRRSTKLSIFRRRWFTILRLEKATSPPRFPHFHFLWLSSPQMLLRPRDASSCLNRRQEHDRSGLTRVDST